MLLHGRGSDALKVCDMTINLPYDLAGLPKPEGEASLKVFLLPASDSLHRQKEKPIVLICPGGGYAYCSDREAEPIAMKFLAEGMHAAVLRYHTAPEAHHPVPLLEAAWAVKTIRQHAGEWHVIPDNVFICGFSAGGHLAASLSVFYDEPLLKQVLGSEVSLRPDGQILGYPVITMQDDFTHKGSRENLFGEGNDKILKEQLSLERHISPSCPPAFLFHTMEDGSVPVENSLQYACALRRAGVPFEMHVFEKGGHGLSTCDALTATSREGIVPDNGSWIRMAIAFVRRHSHMPQFDETV